MPRRARPCRPKTYIREWRKHRRMTQEQLADRLGKTKGWVSQIESGTIPYTQDTLEALAEALSIEPADLLRRDPTEAEEMWAVWNQAEAAERLQIVEVAKALITAGKKPSN